MTTNLTRGAPTKNLLLFTVPFLIGNLFQQLYNIADMVIVGRVLSPTAYAAVGSVGSLVWFASGAMSALAIGFSMVTARYFGAEDEEGVKKSVASAVKLALAIAVMFSTLCILIARPVLELLKYPADIIDRSYKYLIWILLGLVITVFYHLFANMLRALGDSKTPLYFQVIACVVNIILDYAFIAFFGMDTDGAGLATVLAQLLSVVLCVWRIYRRYPALHVERRHFASDRVMNRDLLKTGLPMVCLTLVVSSGSIMVQTATNRMGTLYVTAQTTGSKIENIAVQPIMSLSSALSVFAAQNFGAKQYGRVLQGVRSALLLGYCWYALAVSVVILLGKPIVRLLAGSITVDVVNNAYRYAAITVALSALLIPVVMFKCVLQATDRPLWPMISGFTEIVGRVGLSVMTILWMQTELLGTSISEQMGFNYMCFANPCAWLICLLTVLPSFVTMSRYFCRKTIEEKPAQKGESYVSFSH